MTKRFGNLGKLAVLGLAIAATAAVPVSASARGWGGYHGGYHGGYGHGYYGHGGYWSGGRWIAGALVTGAVVGLVANALAPPPVYYGAPVVYAQPGVVYAQPRVVYAQPGVVYQDGPPVASSQVIYNNPPPAQYVRDDGYSN